jgi:hypothetical protein
MGLLALPPNVSLQVRKVNTFYAVGGFCDFYDQTLDAESTVLELL